MENKKATLTILMAARNEAANIKAALLSIVAQTVQYPGEIRILVGNDGSEDATLAIARRLEATYSFITVVDINTQIAPHLKGKTNVLATLAKLVDSPYMGFIDADIILPPTWYATIMPWAQKYTTVNGITGIDPVNLFSKLQSIDWLTAVSTMALVTSLGIPVTGIGNNMIMETKAYLGTGGYEALPFSITEDLEIYKAMVSNGGTFLQLAIPGVLAISQPAVGLKAYFSQRRRWLSGGLQTPLPIRLPFFGQFVYYALMIVMVLFSPMVALGMFGVRYLFSTLTALAVVIKLKQWKLLSAIPLFETYYMICYSTLLVSYALHNNIEWKNRTYDK